jgi:serine/threonine protein kinase
MAEFRGTDRFQILNRLGAGGMGDVYEALDKERNTRVALKVLTSLAPDALVRFKREFRDFQHLSHRNLISLGEFFSSEGSGTTSGHFWFFTMELVENSTTFLQYVRPGIGSTRRAAIDSMSTAAAAPGVTSLRPMQSAPEPEPTRGTLDEPRLRSSLRQLAIGLCALHDAGKVHRDIKPSNVLVDVNGRVVILDFGIATAIVVRWEESLRVIGTPVYMAPEQSAGRHVGPAADWYAVGVLLFQALSGILPRSATVAGALQVKHDLDDLSIRRLLPDAPEDLARLCADLLKFQPAERLNGRQVLERLGAEVPVSVRISDSPTEFVGRAEELELLRGQLARRGDAHVVLVHGEPGIGKSAFVRHFVKREQERLPDLVALTGICYEREAVPFKAVDGIIDALSQHLRRLPKATVAALLPRRVSLLAEVFPVLMRVEGIAQAPRFASRWLDPAELRKQIFAALRELLARLSDRHPVVLVIDDLQWADADSFALLGELLRAPDSPALLVVATVRSDLDAVDDEWRSRFGGADIHHLALSRLSQKEGHALAERLLRREGADLDATSLALEGSGNPMLIGELIRHAAGAGTPTTASLQLDDALWARIDQLEGHSRRVLEVVAISSARLKQSTVAEAVGIAVGECAIHIEHLRKVRLVRTTGTHETDAVEPYHQKVRQAVLAKLSPEVVADYHRRLATAMEACGHSASESLAHHWYAAGDKQKAADHAEVAAEKAVRSLAFNRAAELFTQSLFLLGATAPSALHVKLGDALARAGRASEAAIVYLRAAQRTSAAERFELHRRAGEQYLRCGHLAEGLQVFDELQDELSMPLAKTPQRAVTGLRIRRAQLVLRGLRYREKEASSLSRPELTRIDAAFGMALALSTVDSLQAADLQSRQLLLALKTGEPYRISIAFSLSALFNSQWRGARGRRHTATLQQKATEIARRINHPHALGLALWAEGAAGYFEGRFRDSVQRCEDALEFFREHCSDAACEIASANAFGLWSRFYCGELKEIARRLPGLLESARARGDLQEAAHLRASHTNTVWLAADRPEHARLEIEEALREWTLWSPNQFCVHQCHELFGLTQNDIYVGDAQAAWRRVSEGWAKVETSYLLRFPTMRIEMHDLRARAAIAAATASTTPREAAALVATAARDATRLGREEAAWATGLGLLVRAQVSALRRDPETSAAELRRAAERFDEVHMALHAAVARRCVGSIVGGEEGAGLVRAADAWMSSQCIKKPERMAQLLAPGFATLP